MRARTLPLLSLVAAAALACSAPPEKAPEPTVAIVAPPSSTEDDPLVVMTSHGPIRGAMEASGTRVWKGIPYAAPPTGALRFRPPAPAAPWTEPRTTTSYASECVQLDERGRVIGDEDCLYLNVWAPEASRAERLPVLFWIHGGDNVIGAASDPWYDGARLAERAKAIVVTINYRLGAFGWLAHPAFRGEDPHGATGNYGLHDAIAALTWVQKNITALGGDPSRVLVFGQSAGASNTCALVASPLARGLFSRAMMLSLSCHAVEDSGVESTNEVVTRRLGCTGASDVPACLRGKSASELARLPGASLQPTDEPADYYETVDGWALPEHPEMILAKGKHNPMPLVMGTTRDEYASILDLMLEEPVDTPDQYASVLEGWYGARIAARIVALYPFGRYRDGRAAMVDVVSDSLMHCPTRRAARAAAATQAAPVYRYWFAQAPTKGPSALHGAAHGVDVDYVFRFPAPSISVDPTPDDLRVSDELVSSIAALARDGSPEGASSIVWPRYDREREPLAVISATPTPPPTFDVARCALWDAL
ncbi:MAG: carboxylesterase family protein [Deltaproteobacteria bacterium]|nr:carboxylesterase family protein [Deltaproteobacteria bacterium]